MARKYTEDIKYFIRIPYTEKINMETIGNIINKTIKIYDREK